MSTPAKVLWGEGLFLRPQHFQQQDHYHETRLQRTAHALHPYLWGVQSVEWDSMALKANVLRMREPSRNVIEFRSGDVSAFWLLHTVSTASATLMHYLRHPALHPERLLESMLGLAGALMTYSKSYSLGQLPAYQHEEQGLPALELVEIVPLRVKAGAPVDVDQCVLSAMPGVKLSYAPQVPAAIPVRPDTCYFVLESKGVLYERMLKAQSISIYVPAGIRDLRLELVAVTA
jgi:type VI secretion system protein ImpJ